jgi:vacuolar iron transporter family protein
MLTRNLDKARQAYKKRDSKASREAHENGIHGEERHRSGEHIKSFIYGGLDGIITTFAIVAGVAGASLSSGVVLILGFANLIADGLSMGIGDYLSTKAEREYNASERKREEWEVDNYLEGEKKEMVEIYMSRGIEKADAETIVKIISKDKKTFVDIMMLEELGIVEENESPIKNAVITFFSFVIFGFIPLLAYLVARLIPAFQNTFFIASILTGLTLFALGTSKMIFIQKGWFKSGLEMLAIGGVTAIAAYGIGAFLSGLV